MKKVFNQAQTRYFVEEKIGDVLVTYESGLDEVIIQKRDPQTAREAIFAMSRADFIKAGEFVQRVAP